MKWINSLLSICCATALAGQTFDEFFTAYQLPKAPPPLHSEKALTWEEVESRLPDLRGKTIKLKLVMEAEGADISPLHKTRPDLWEVHAGGPAMIVDKAGRDFFLKLAKSKRAEKTVVVYLDPNLRELEGFVVALGQHATTGAGGRGVFKW